jgi:uncharacterized repeat protein (TIGR03803 family)
MLIAAGWSGVVLPTVTAAPTYKVLKSFGDPDGMGTNPTSTLIQASDGALFGTTFMGGRNKSGTVYRVDADGTNYRVVYHFGPMPTPGTAGQAVHPVGRLLEASDGRLYGTALQAGSAFGGAIYRIEKSGAGFVRLRNFPTSGSQPTNPVAGLIQGSDGLLYGATSESGPNAPGTIFRMGLEGNNYQVLRSFPWVQGNSVSCITPLIEASDGMLYGTSRTGGSTNAGLIFRLNKDGSAYEVIHEFEYLSQSGFSPWGGVIDGQDGFLYGTVEYGSPRGGGGGVYRVARDGSGYQMIWGSAAAAPEDLRRLRGELVQGPDGFLYGVAQEDRSGAPGGAFRVRPDGSGYATLVHLAPVAAEKEHPELGLLLTSDGTLIGVASDWYTNLYPGFLFRLTAGDRAFSIVHHFSSTGGDPSLPWSIVESRDGQFYGATNRKDFTDDFFSVARDGSEARLRYQFAGPTRNEKPVGAELFEGVDGRFYAATYMGGRAGRGSVTRINPDGSGLDILYSLSPETEADLARPQGGIIQASDGFLYGTAGEGGRLNRGAVFRMASDGTGLTVLHSFAPLGNDLSNHPVMQLLEGSDGGLHGVTEFGCYRLNKDGSGFVFNEFPRVGVAASLPRGPLVEMSDGMLYGTTTHGGPNQIGTIFRVNLDGSGLVVLRDFTSASGAPYRPTGSLAEGIDGKIYGVSAYGGTRSDRGALFSMNRDGTEFIRLHSFGAAGDGVLPVTLARSADGLFYGATQYGGAYDFGTFFRFGEAPEIVVEHPAGIGLTSDAGVVEAGEVAVGAAQPVEFIVRNTGELSLGPLVPEITGEMAMDFEVVVLTPTTIAPGQAGVLTLRFGPRQPGRRLATLRLGSNDFDENPFVIQLTGVGLAPDLEVRDGALADAPELSDGQLSPVDFGTARVGAPAARDFRIANLGNAPLEISGVTVPDGFAPVDAASWPVRLIPGESSILRIQFAASAAGDFGGSVVIVSNDPDEPAFRFPVVAAAVTPEIRVHDGPDSEAPVLANGQAAAVDFGRVIQGSAGTRPITIHNDGTAPLLVTSLSAPPGYLFTGGPPLPASVAPGTSLTVPLSLTATTVQSHHGSVMITSDDLDDATFQFPVVGEIYIPPPVVDISDHPIRVNRQTGLLEQIIRLGNDSTATVPAYEIIVSGLPEGVIVHNGTVIGADGRASLIVRQSLGPATHLDLVIEYRTSTRAAVALSPRFETVVLHQLSDDTAPDDGPWVTVDRLIHLGDGGMLIEFTSDPAAEYQVDYSSDGQSWHRSPIVVPATGTRTQWIDRGPPRTSQAPLESGTRLYRLRRVPAP